MADGYLEKRMEDYLAGKLKPARKKFKPAQRKSPPAPADNKEND